MKNNLDEYIVLIAKNGKRSEEASFNAGDGEVDNLLLHDITFDNIR